MASVPKALRKALYNYIDKSSEEQVELLVKSAFGDSNTLKKSETKSNTMEDTRITD